MNRVTGPRAVGGRASLLRVVCGPVGGRVSLLRAVRGPGRLAVDYQGRSGEEEKCFDLFNYPIPSGLVLIYVLPYLPPREGD